MTTTSATNFRANIKQYLDAVIYDNQEVNIDEL